MTNFRTKSGALQPMGSKLKRVRALAGVNADELTTKGQHEDGSMSPVYDDLTVNGTFTATALNVDSVAPAITAKAGGGQDATLALSKNLNIVTTVATAADSVTLPAAVVGLRITIVNLGANPLAVFPYTSDTINDEAADASVTIQPETTVTFNCYTGVKWESDNESAEAFDKLTVAGVATFGSGNVYKALTTQTALAGGAQAGTALTAEYTNFTVVATAGDSAQLPTPVLGSRRIVTNSATSKLPMAVFGQTGASIDNGSANASVLIGYGETVIFEAISATEWKTHTGSMNIATGIITEERTITSAEIVGTAAGDLGHANGVELVAAAGSGYALEFISAIAIYDFATAAYTGGGDDTSIRLGGGGAAITGAVTSANLIGAAGDKIVRFDPLSTAALPVSVGVNISMVSTTAWTQPGTAAGVLRVQTSYRIHKTGL